MVLCAGNEPRRIFGTPSRPLAMTSCYNQLLAGQRHFGRKSSIIHRLPMCVKRRGSPPFGEQTRSNGPSFQKLPHEMASKTKAGWFPILYQAGSRSVIAPWLVAFQHGDNIKREPHMFGVLCVTSHSFSFKTELHFWTAHDLFAHPKAERNSRHSRTLRFRPVEMSSENGFVSFFVGTPLLWLLRKSTSSSSSSFFWFFFWGGFPARQKKHPQIWLEAFFLPQFRFLRANETETESRFSQARAALRPLPKLEGAPISIGARDVVLTREEFPGD